MSQTIDVPGFGPTEFPDGMSDDQIVAAIKANARTRQQQQVPEFEREAQRIKNADPFELAVGSAPGRFVQGMAAPFVGAAQLGANAIGQGQAVNDAVSGFKRATERGREAYGSEGYDWANLAGNVVSPAGLAVAKGIPLASTLAGKTAQGAAIGAGFGATAPVEDQGDYWGKKGAQTALGAGVGAAIPLVAAGIGVGAGAAYKGFIEPKIDAATVKGRTLVKGAGDNVEELIAALRRNSTPDATGTIPTAGQAASEVNAPAFSALAQAGRERMPQAYNGRIDEQNAAQLAALHTIGKDSKAFDLAKQLREQAAGPHYAQADATVVQGDAALEKLMARPSMDKVFARAKELAAEKGREFSPTETSYHGYSLQDVKMAMDDLTRDPTLKEKFGIGASELGAIRDTRSAFVDWMNKSVPGWEKARTEYAANSLPMNQMQIGQYLENTAGRGWQPNAGGQPLNAKAYAEALRKSTDVGDTAMAGRAAELQSKKVTGSPRYQELAAPQGPMDPKQMELIDAVNANMQRQQRLEGQAKTGASQLRELTPVPKGEDIQLWNRKMSIYHWVKRHAIGMANEDLANQLAKDMIDPTVTANMMTRYLSKSQKASMLADTLGRASIPAAGAGIQQYGR